MRIIYKLEIPSLEIGFAMFGNMASKSTEYELQMAGEELTWDGRKKGYLPTLLKEHGLGSSRSGY